MTGGSMQYNDRKEYETLIADSPLFSLDKDEEYAAFKRESYKMVEYLYCYLLSLNEAAYEPYGCEITELAVKCIKNYDRTKGVFLHYFNAAWKQEFSRIRRNQYQDETYRGLHLTEEDRRSVLKYIKLAGQIESTCSAEELYDKLSAAMGLSTERIRYLAELSTLNVCGDSYINDEGQEQSIWDCFQPDEETVSHLETREGIEEVLEKIEEKYCRLQERQKALISDMMTVKVCTFLENGQISRFSFINESVVQNWTRSGRLPTQREIAEKYGRSEASISRTMKEFIEKLKEK